MAYNGISRFGVPIQGTCSGGEVVVHGSFLPDGTNDPTTITGDWIESVTHDSTGVWDVVLQSTGPQFICAQVSLQADTYGDRAVLLGPYTASSRTLRVFGSSAGSANNLSTNDVVHITAVFRLKNITRE
jgi:hypothetical protein